MGPVAPSCRRRLMVALAVVVLAPSAACGSASQAGSRPASETSQGKRTTTTMRTTAPTTAAASTTLAASTTTGGASSAVVVPADAPVVTALDAVLRAPATPEQIDTGGREPCLVLSTGRPAGRCGTLPLGAGASPAAPDGAGGLVWFAAAEGGAPPNVVQIFRLDGTMLRETARLPEGVQPDYEPARVVAADLDGRPGDELVVGLRSLGTGGFLEVEVLDATGTVVAHRSLDQGRARLDQPGIVTWSAQYGPDDPNCCPGSYRRERIVYDDGRWRAIAEGTVPPGQVPESQL